MKQPKYIEKSQYIINTFQMRFDELSNSKGIKEIKNFLQFLNKKIILLSIKNFNSI